MPRAKRNVKSWQMPSYQVFSEGHGGHWVAWISSEAGGKPHRSVILVGRTQEEAEARAREWAARASN
jgi:hypothetical protein